MLKSEASRSSRGQLQDIFELEFLVFVAVDVELVGAVGPVSEHGGPCKSIGGLVGYHGFKHASGHIRVQCVLSTPGLRDAAGCAVL